MLDRLRSFLIFIAIVLIPIQDSRLQGTALRAAGASPTALILSLLALLVFVEEAARQWVSRRVIGIGVATLVFVVGVTSYYIILYQTRYSAEDLPARALKYGILLALALLPLWVIPKCDPNWIRRATYVAFWVTVLGVVAGDVFRSSWVLNTLHFTLNTNMRPRGLSLESTTLGVTIGDLAFLAAYFTPRLMVRLIYIATALVVIAYAQSKGGAIAIALAIALAAVIAERRMTRASLWKTLGRLALPAVFVLAIGGALAASFSRSLNQYTSVTTRVTAITAAGETVLHNPLGMGLGGMLPAMNTYLPAAIVDVQKVGLFTNFEEIASYINNRSGVDIDTKSFLFDQMVIFGIPFLFVFWAFHRRLLAVLTTHREFFWLLAGLLFSAIALTFYYPGLGDYNAPLVYGVALAAVQQYESIGRSA